ncbi:type II toxin-antitoxin system HicB family antitoxin [Rodentibacter caecimuris]|uniref:type II toxin-antitoxin system HicB family antitoxin n=1 Tax=Rodentibacter caecimuris TaxID=1796644 RepID=UPI002119E9A3|nr:type II toxin-antitoxin system HicB family antitoxin [Rodentibacter heylii]MCQ9124365.1 type II toxin-antitoxin system HicB family antitoxin [Rodentibacter heylii]
MLYPIALEKVSDGYVVSVPDIPGCYSAGDTLDETIANVKQAISEHLELLVRDGEEVPQPTSIENHKDSEDYEGADIIFSVIEVDISHLLGKAERINITLPAFLIKRIDDFVSVHKEYKNRSQFIAKVASDKIFTL